MGKLIFFPGQQPNDLVFPGRGRWVGGTEATGDILQYFRDDNKRVKQKRFGERGLVRWEHHPTEEFRDCL